jgi:DNA polymerase-4
MERDILHLAIPVFAIALARVVDPSLRTRPVAIAANHSDRALLQSVSLEAGQDGIVPGMSVFHALRLNPALTLLPPDSRLLARGTRALHDLAAGYSPVLEPAAPGRLFLDLTGCRRLAGAGRDVALRLEREMTGRLRLQGTVGVAGNKLVSRIAAGFLEQPGVCDVLRGSEAGFIGPLPVATLPGIGGVREALLLRDLNLRLVREVAALSVAQLWPIFGAFAPLLHQRACGIDPSPVRPPRRTQEVAEETFLVCAENDDAVLLAELSRLVEGCGLQLRRLGKSAGRLTLTVDYADGVTAQRTVTLAPPQRHDELLWAAAAPLLHTTCSRRIRIKGLRLVLDRLAPAARQLELFDAAAGSPALQAALDQLRDKYGMAAVRRGRSLAA